MTHRIALLRGINVGGHKKIPMATLRKLCTGLGWQQVSTYIQSGNVVFQSPGNSASLETALTTEIHSQLGFDVPVLVRSFQQWRAICNANPFPAPSESEPALVMLGLAKKPIPGTVAAELQSRVTNSERVKQLGNALWVHFPKGSARSKITPILLDRLAGSPVTSRNWRTVSRILQMMQEQPSA